MVTAPQSQTVDQPACRARTAQLRMRCLQSLAQAVSAQVFDQQLAYHFGLGLATLLIDDPQLVVFALRQTHRQRCHSYPFIASIADAYDIAMHSFSPYNTR